MACFDLRNKPVPDDVLLAHRELPVEITDKGGGWVWTVKETLL
jgi:hypothetical protein